MRNIYAGLIKPSEELVADFTAILQGTFAKFWIDEEDETGQSLIEEGARGAYLKAIKDAERLGFTRLTAPKIWKRKDDYLGVVYLDVYIGHGLGRYNYEKQQDGTYAHWVWANILTTNDQATLARLQSYRKIVRHELTHAYQKQMALDYGVAEAGLPNTRSNPHFKQTMLEKEKELRRQYEQEGGDPSKIYIHSLDDIEFYTTLLDEVETFRDTPKTPSMLSQNIHKWVSVRPFFVSLRRFRQKEWKKAVGLFFEEVSRDAGVYKKTAAAKKNVPVDEKLWAEVQALAKGERNKPVSRGSESVNPVNEGKGFRTFPSAYANGWALAQYKRLGGKWKKEGSDYSQPRKWDKAHCEAKTCDEMGFSEKASCRPYKNCYKKASAEVVASRYAAKRDNPKMKNTGKGGLGTWFAGHGGGDPDDRATWGDWVAITPVKHTIKKEDGSDKTYEPGDIVGACAVSSEKEWATVTGNGSKPLKCMPREKAWGMSKEERAELAKNKRREEAKHRGQKPVNTPTFSEAAEEVLDKKGSVRYADFYREITPPDSLSSLSNGTPISSDKDTVGATHSALPNGDTARNIGRPSPDSPNLKYRNLDKSEANGRKPANRQDFGYVHDSGSGSARVIPYDSGFANNGSVLRK